MPGRILTIAGLTIAGLMTSTPLQAGQAKTAPPGVASGKVNVQDLSLKAHRSTPAAPPSATARTKKKPVKKAPVTLSAGKASLQDFH